MSSIDFFPPAVVTSSVCICAEGGESTATKRFLRPGLCGRGGLVGRGQRQGGSGGGGGGGGWRWRWWSHLGVLLTKAQCDAEFERKPFCPAPFRPAHHQRYSLNAVFTGSCIVLGALFTRTPQPVHLPKSQPIALVTLFTESPSPLHRMHFPLIYCAAHTVPFVVCRAGVPRVPLADL